MKKILLLLLVFSLLFSLALVGCANKDEEEAETTKVEETKKEADKEEEKEEPKEETKEEEVKEEPKEDAPEVEEVETVSLKFTYWGSPVEKDAVLNALDGFYEAFPNIDVEALHIPDEYETKIATMMAADDAPDVAYLGVGTALKWAEEGELYNIKTFLDNDPELNVDSYLESVWYWWSETETLGTNTAVEAFATFYNEDMFVEAGVDLPPTTAETAWTYDEFVEVAKLMTIDQNGNNAASADFDPENIKQYGIKFGTWYGPWFWAVQSAGGDIINEDGTEFTLTEPVAVDAIQKMADLINVYHVAPSPIQAQALPSSSIALQTKQIAMTFEGQWALLDLADTGMNFGIGVLPKIEKSTTLVLGAPTVIFADTPYPDQSWSLFKFLADPNYSIELQAGGLWMPLFKDWYTDPELINKWAVGNDAHPEEYVDALMNQTLNNGVPGPEYYVKNWSEVDALLSPALEQVWLGEKTAQEALDEVAPLIEEVLEGRYINYLLED